MALQPDSTNLRSTPTHGSGRLQISAGNLFFHLRTTETMDLTNLPTVDYTHSTQSTARLTLSDNERFAPVAEL